MNIKTVTMRQMQAKDIRAAYKLWQELGMFLAAPKHEVREITQLLKHNPGMSFVAVVREELIGTVVGAWTGRRAWVHHLAVARQWQRQGIGALLLNKQEKVFCQVGVTKVLLGVSMNNLKVVPFYEKYGFTVMPDALYFSKQLNVK